MLVAFLEEVAALAHGDAALSAAQRDFLVAYRQMSQVIGADLGGGWKQAIDFMLDNVEEVKAYRKELERLEAVIAKETDPAKLAHIRDRAYEAERKTGVHSQLKGLLGELYARRWKDWRLIKSGYMDIAKRLAAKLGSSWEAVPVTGRMFIGGDEVWDDAILLVRRGSVPPKPSSTWPRRSKRHWNRGQSTRRLTTSCARLQPRTYVSFWPTVARKCTC